MADTSPLVIDPPTLRRILEHAPGFVVVFDLDLRIRYINRPAAGYRLEDVIGATMESFVPQEGQRLRRIYDEVREQGVEAQMEYVVDQPDGKSHWYVARVAPLRDQQHELLGFISISNDITAEKRVEQELKKTQGALADASQRAGMAEVITGVLHSVGNVINSVNVATATLRQELSASHVDMLARTVALCEEQGERLPEFLAHDPRGQKVLALLGRVTQQIIDERRRLQAEVQRMIEHVNLVRSTVEMQQLVARTGAMLEDARPEELIERALSVFRAELESQRIHTELEIEEGLRLLLDTQATLQILINLVRNAIEALSKVQEPRTLRIRGYARDGRVSFEVEDNGAGIEVNELASLFRDGLATKKIGHGLGLHVSAIVARAMGGSLEAESEGPGQGARFCLSLPLQRIE